MSTVELPSGVHHGTPEGHLAGCKGERADCPALSEHGMSCTYAYVRSTTTPDRYYKAKARNPDPREIARTLGFKPTTPATALAAVIEADATLPHPTRKPSPPRERTAPMTEPEPTTSPTAEEASAPPATIEPSTTEIRAWAKKTGISVPIRGPIPKDVAIAYDIAHSAHPTPRPLTMADFTHGLSQSATRERGHEIRAWLRVNGYPRLADRGIVPPSALYAYLLAHPGATDPAQPLAEQSHDPSDNTPAHADGAAAAPAETAAEGEDMGRTTSPVHAVIGEHGPEKVTPLHAPATEELIDQVRDRIDMPKPAIPGLLTISEARAAAGIQTAAPHIPPLSPRPEWAEVTTSNEVAAALADRDAALEQRDQARSLAARLWDELVDAEERARVAEAALELTLTQWDTATTTLAAERRTTKFLFRRIASQDTELAELRRIRRRLTLAAAGWQARATNLQTTLDDAPLAPLTPARRGILPWKKRTR